VAAQVLVKLGADLSRVCPRQQVIQLLSGYSGKEATSGAPRSATAPTGSLGSTSSAANLTQLAREKKLDPVIGRERERVMQVLSRRTKNNPVLIGEPCQRSHKTAIVEGLA
jgi:ATP-dependent Clp protease ATP-binding subunit ClpC